MLSIPVRVLKRRLSAEYAPLQAFAPEPRWLHANLTAKTPVISLALTGDDLLRLHGSSTNR
jgi:hypothetical protein